MKHLASRVSQLIPNWNKRVLTENDALAFCELHEISVIETDLIDNEGEFRVYKNHGFIFLNPYLRSSHRSWVFWHEIGHAILHYPVTCKFLPNSHSKLEKEAEIVACFALIPITILALSDFELFDEYGYPFELIRQRRRIYEIYRK